MKCPSCKAEFKIGTVSCPNCGRYCGKSLAPDTEEVFMTENINPINGGYTQQQKNAAVIYTTPDGNRTENPYNEIFSPVQKNISPENYSESQRVVPHNPISNPYADMESHFDKKPILQPIVSDNPYSRTPHTTEFIPNDVVEFAKHMDARSRSRELRFFFYGMPVIGIISIFTACLVDTTAAIALYMIFHTIILTVFAVIMKKTYGKSAAAAFSVYTFICVVIMISNYSNIYNRYICNYTYVIFAYIPIVFQVSLNIGLIISIKDYYNAWEKYLQTGNVPPKSTAFKDKMKHLDSWIRDRT